MYGKHLVYVVSNLKAKKKYAMFIYLFQIFVLNLQYGFFTLSALGA